METERNWLKRFTSKVISGYIIIRYNSVPIKARQNVGFSSKEPVVRLRGIVGSIGIELGLEANMLVSASISKAYFLQKIAIFVNLGAISIPKIYLDVSKSLTLNSFFKRVFNLAISSLLLLVIMISSTYTRRVFP